MVSLDRYNGIYNGICNDPFDGMSVPNETEVVNLNAINMIADINESNKLKKKFMYL